MWHTLPEAITLTGRSRRSLYRDMDAGRVSYRVRGDNRRELETSELIRAYGPLARLAQPAPTETAQPGIPHGTVPIDALAPLLEELRLLRAELAELRGTMLRIEHKPTKQTKLTKPIKQTKQTTIHVLDTIRARVIRLINDKAEKWL